MRTDDGAYWLVETKGRHDLDVPRKAIAANEWCKTASKSGTKWQYVFTPQDLMEKLTGNRFADLARACVPALQNLLSETTAAPELPFFGTRPEGDAETFYNKSRFEKLPARAKKAATDALELYRFFEHKEGSPNLAPVFNTLLGPYDAASKAVIFKLLQGRVPASRAEQQSWFDPYMDKVDRRSLKHYQNMASGLRRALVYGNVHSAIGLLRSCFDFAVNDQSGLDGVFDAVRDAFNIPGAGKLLERISAVNEFRNTYIAHHEKELTDKALAEEHLKGWVETLALLRA